MAVFAMITDFKGMKSEKISLFLLFILLKSSPEKKLYLA